MKRAHSEGYAVARAGPARNRIAHGEVGRVKLSNLAKRSVVGDHDTVWEEEELRKDGRLL